jgi:hypothetical protein
MMEARSTRAGLPHRRFSPSVKLSKMINVPVILAWPAKTLQFRLRLVDESVAVPDVAESAHHAQAAAPCRPSLVGRDR